MEEAIERARKIAAKANKGGFSDGPPVGEAAMQATALQAVMQMGLAQIGGHGPSVSMTRFADDTNKGDPLTIALRVALSVQKTARASRKIMVPEEPGVNFMGLLLGPRGATLKDMVDRTGAKIIIRGKGSQREGTQATHSHEDDLEPMHVAIDGPEESVARAVAEVEALLFDPRYREEMKSAQLGVLGSSGIDPGADGALIRSGLGLSSWMVTPYAAKSGETNYECRIPNSMVGLVIGRGGENIKRIQSEYGVRVQIAKEPEPPEITENNEAPMRRIALTGTNRGIDRAREMIEDILKARAANLSSSAESFDLKVPNDKVGLIIGKSGATIRSLQERTGVTVKVPPAPDPNTPHIRTLQLCADTQHQIQAAKVEIDQIISDEIARSSGTFTDADCEIFPCPEGCVGLIIGKGGETIHKIQSATGVRIQIPQHAEPNSVPPTRMLGVVGTPDARQRAIFEISQLVAQHELRHGKAVDYGSVGPPPDPYANPGFVDPYAPNGTYDPMATYAQQQPEADQNYAYSQQQQQQQAWQASGQSSSQVPAATPAEHQPQTEYKPEDYYNDFWNYAGWYGEETARLYYGDYAPPPGTQPPPHITLPAPGQEPGAHYYASGDAYAQQAAPVDASQQHSAAPA